MVGETLASAASVARPLRVYVAGTIALRGADGAAVGERDLAGRQGRRVFVRLAAIHAPVLHEDLADDLWGPEWPGAWDVALRALVSKLRAALIRVGAPGALVAGGGTYALHLPRGTWLDLDAAAASVHEAEGALRGGDLPGAAGWALGARAIATRPVLPGEDGEWLEAIRRRQADVRLRALAVLAETWIARGDAGLAARDAAEAVELDPYHEPSHRLLIRAHLAAGDHGAAARAGGACRRLFRDELGVEPSAETMALLDAARAPGPTGRRRGT